MDKKKPKNYLLKALLISFIIFLIIYITTENGYYEYKVYTKTKLTEESIVRFEEDIQNNEDVSTYDYVVNEYVDYSNSFSTFGSSLGTFVEKSMNYIIKKSLEILSDLFYN